MFWVGWYGWVVGFWLFIGGGFGRGRISAHPGQCFGTPLCRRKITMRASARLLFAIAFIGGMDNPALAGSRASLADLLGQGYGSQSYIHAFTDGSESAQ